VIPPRAAHFLFAGAVSSTFKFEKLRKPCPTSLAGPRGSGFEIIVNLVVMMDTACASDLLNRNALGDNAIRPTPIVREEGEPVAQFVRRGCVEPGLH